MQNQSNRFSFWVSFSDFFWASLCGGLGAMQMACSDVRLLNLPPGSSSSSQDSQELISEQWLVTESVFQEFGPSGTGQNSVGGKVSSNGLHTVGTIQMPSKQQGFHYAEGFYFEVIAPMPDVSPANLETRTRAVNDNGLMVGAYGDVPTFVDTPMVYDLATNTFADLSMKHDFHQPGSSAVDGLALDINNQGQIIGYLYDGDFMPVKNVIWDSPSSDPVVIPFTVSAINQKGVVVGQGCAFQNSSNPSSCIGIDSGYLWDKGALTEISPPENHKIVILDVNDNNEVVGTFYGPNLGGFLWRDGVFHALESGMDPDCAFPRAINNEGMVLVTCNQKGILRIGEQVIELNDLIPTGTSWTSLKPSDLSEVSVDSDKGFSQVTIVGGAWDYDSSEIPAPYRAFQLKLTLKKASGVFKLGDQRASKGRSVRKNRLNLRQR